MTARKRTRKAIWVDDIKKFGMETGFAASLHTYLLSGSAPQDGESIQAVAQFLQAGRSALELRWAALGQALIEERYHKRVIFTGYEWETFKIPGGSYTPDFFYLLADGRRVYVEVKPGKFMPSYRDARTRLRAAASLNPWVDFLEVIEGSSGWNLEAIPPDIEFVRAFLTLPF